MNFDRYSYIVSLILQGNSPQNAFLFPEEAFHHTASITELSTTRYHYLSHSSCGLIRHLILKYGSIKWYPLCKSLTKPGGILRFRLVGDVPPAAQHPYPCSMVIFPKNRFPYLGIFSEKMGVQQFQRNRVTQY